MIVAGACDANRWRRRDMVDSWTTRMGSIGRGVESRATASTEFLIAGFNGIIDLQFPWSCAHDLSRPLRMHRRNRSAVGASAVEGWCAAGGARSSGALIDHAVADFLYLDFNDTRVLAFNGHAASSSCDELDRARGAALRPLGSRRRAHAPPPNLRPRLIRDTRTSQGTVPLIATPRQSTLSR